MDILQIVYIVLIAFLAVALTWLFVRNSKRTETLKLLSEKKNLEAETEILKADTEKLKAMYQQQLTEANLQTEKLEGQLRQMLDGKVDDVVQTQLAGVEQMKKKIKSLQQEIDDLNEKIDACNLDLEENDKKLKKKDSEISQLQDEIDASRRSNKKLNQELEAKKSELDDRLKDLNLKIESLSFIQEILEAKELKTDDVAGLYRKVDNVADFIQNDFKDCLKANHKENSEQYVSIAGGLSRWEVTSKKSWIAGKTTIAFVGEFSAGKTSIVNRILSQDDPNVPTLPVSTKATTAIPTYIASTLVGSITRYSFVSPDNKRKNIEGKTFKRVSKDILDQVKGLSSLIKYFVMEYNNPNLNGLSILDTPGFNSNDPEDSQRTIDVINECDALFWVFDVNAGTVNRSSISLIKKYLKKPLYVVINKIDTKVETEVNKVEQLIRKTLRDEGVEVKKFIRFSGKEPLDSIIKPIQSVSHDTSQDTYLENVNTLLEETLMEAGQQKDSALHSYNNQSSEVDNLTSQVNNELRRLTSKCDEAACIPQWKEGVEFFVKLTKDKYEMTPEQHSRFVNILNAIKSQAGNMNALSNRRNESVKAMQKMYVDYASKRELFQRTQSCLETFNRLRNNLMK